MLQEIKLNAREIDEYIAEFEDLARQANYTLGNAETIRLFVQGLTPSMMKDVMKLPYRYGFLPMKGYKNSTHTHTHQTHTLNPYGLPKPTHITSEGMASSKLAGQGC